MTGLMFILTLSTDYAELNYLQLLNTIYGCTKIDNRRITDNYIRQCILYFGVPKLLRHTLSSIWRWLYLTFSHAVVGMII
jgi:hypothetical protein